MKKIVSLLLGILLLCVALIPSLGVHHTFAESGPGLASLPVKQEVQAFFAPAQKKGSIVIRLYPTENVNPGTSTLVTFGVPFPRDSVTLEHLDKVRVLKNGDEIPAYVEQMTPWRHMTNDKIDGQSVRVARIQIHHTFSKTFPGYEEITVEWGSKNRKQSVAEFENPRSAWHLVTSGTFSAQDNVYEPDVYAVLPKEYLSEGALRPNRMMPIDDSVPLTRQDPALMKQQLHMDGYLAYDYSSVNNFYSAINEDDPRETQLIKYKTDGVAWLFDRSSTMFVTYMRSGSFKMLREAVRSTEFYRTKLRDDGLFSLRASAMYSTNENLAYAYWLTGDDVMRDTVPKIVNAYKNSVYRWSPSLGFWTERIVGLKLLANVVAYEVLGDQQYKETVQDMADALIWHQNGADGQIPAGRVDGGLYHTSEQHDEGLPNTWIASPWMSVFVNDAMVRTYAFTERVDIASFIKRLGNVFKSASKRAPGDVWAEEPPYESAIHLYEDVYPQPLVYPDYMMSIDGTSNLRWYDDVEHAIDVAGATAWAAYFSELLGTPDPELKQLANDLYFTHEIGINHWIIPLSQYPDTYVYRITPARKYSWQYRTTGSFSWIMENLHQAGVSK